MFDDDDYVKLQIYRRSSSLSSSFSSSSTTTTYDDHREIYNIFTLCAKTSSPLSATI
jgi:hypothetical protein